MESLGRHYHLVGIGGAGMSALALVLLARGVFVSGSDMVASEATAQLQQRGAAIRIGHCPDNVPADADAVVASSAVPADNAELVRAGELGIPVWERMDLLARIMHQGRGIGIAGTHGKTTTTSMVALVLERAGVDPTVLVGGKLSELGGNARHGAGSFVVAEVDESDGTFVRLRPFVAVCTNVEDDHLDHYHTTTDLRQAFVTYLEQTDPDGFRVVCGDDSFLRDVGLKLPGRTLMYGFGPNCAVTGERTLVDRGTTTYQVSWPGGRAVGQLQVPGSHNVVNALAAITVAHGLGLNTMLAVESLAGFQGVGRRFETIARGDVWIVDDYAHHPTEVAATLTAAREVWPGRILVVFQPHRYSRTRMLFRRFGESFSAADLVLITDVYAAGETPEAGVDGRLVADEIARRTGAVRYTPTLDDAERTLIDEVRPGDLLLTVGAGNVRLVGERLARAWGLGSGGKET